MQKKPPERLTAELKLRVSEPVRRAIEKAAKLNGVSLNTEIHNRLEWSISPMAEEVLRLTFPNGMLRLRDEDIKHIKKRLNEWVDKFQTAMEG